MPESLGWLGEHLADDRPTGHRLAAQVELERPVPALGRQLVDRAVAEPPAAAAGDREQPVDPSEPGNGRCRRRRRPRAAIREVRGRPSRPARLPASSCSARPRAWSAVRETTNTEAPSAAHRTAVAAAIPVEPVMRRRDRAADPSGTRRCGDARRDHGSIVREVSVASHDVSTMTPVDGPRWRSMLRVSRPAPALRQRFRAHHLPGPPITRR